MFRNRVTRCQRHMFEEADAHGRERRDATLTSVTDIAYEIGWVPATDLATAGDTVSAMIDPSAAVVADKAAALAACAEGAGLEAGAVAAYVEGLAGLNDLCVGYVHAALDELFANASLEPNVPADARSVVMWSKFECSDIDRPNETLGFTPSPHTHTHTHTHTHQHTPTPFPSKTRAIVRAAL